MTATAKSDWLAPWRLLGVMQLVALAAAVSVGIDMLHDVARLLGRVHRVHQRGELARAGRVAEQALQASFAPACDRSRDETLRSDNVRVLQLGDSLVVETRLASGGSHWFAAEHLPGAAPPALTQPPLDPGAGTDPATVDAVVANAALPPLDPEALAAAPRAHTSPLLRREPGLALAHFAAGTDADDWVLRAPPDHKRRGCVGGLLVIPGHLWVEPEATPLQLSLTEDLVLVVAGNLYMLRSVQVQGPGRLLFVTMVPENTTAFCDEDFNGRRSANERLVGSATFAGQIEGAGGVYLGRTRGTAIECQAGLVVAGTLHLGSDCRVAGPLVVADTVARASGAEELVASREWGFLPDRERVPGFVTHGGARPGRLRYLGREAPPALTMRQQTLYVSTPAR
jgi:hypothetical protein